MDLLLDETEARVLGALIEKEITTPEYYPLSLNALVNACNQKSSRDPVMQLDEIAVERALSRLEDLELVRRGRDSRVPKYEHQARSGLDLKRPEIAVLCLLILRGPQTPGELRNRADRLYAFDDIASVQTVLERMMRSEPIEGDGADRRPRAALVTLLPRQPGEKEARYAHTLSGAWVAAGREAFAAPREAESLDRVGRLEAEVAALRSVLEGALARLDALDGGLPEADEGALPLSSSNS